MLNINTLHIQFLLYRLILANAYHYMNTYATKNTYEYIKNHISGQYTYHDTYSLITSLVIMIREDSSLTISQLFESSQLLLLLLLLLPPPLPLLLRLAILIELARAGIIKEDQTSHEVCE